MERDFGKIETWIRYGRILRYLSGACHSFSLSLSLLGTSCFFNDLCWFTSLMIPPIIRHRRRRGKFSSWKKLAIYNPLRYLRTEGFNSWLLNWSNSFELAVPFRNEKRKEKSIRMCNWKYVFAVFISNFYNFLLLEFSNWIQNLTKQFERMQYVLARGSGRIETVQHRSISPLFVYMYIYIYE